MKKIILSLLVALMATTGANAQIAVTDNGNGTYDFDMPAYDVEVTMKVVKLQHKSRILADSETTVFTVSGPLNYRGAGGDHEAGSRGGGEWDDEEDW